MTDENEPDFNFDQYDDPRGVTHLLPDEIKRRVVWNIVPCADVEAALPLVGLTPSSEEVAEAEHRDMHERLLAVDAVTPLLHGYSVYAAEAIQAALMVAHGVDPDSEMTSVPMMASVIFQSTWAILAELVDINLVHLGFGTMVVETVDTRE